LGIKLRIIKEYENRPRLSVARFLAEYFETGKVEKIEISFLDENGHAEYYITTVTGSSFIVNSNADTFVKTIAAAEHKLRIKPDQRFSTKPIQRARWYPNDRPNIPHSVG